MIKIVADTSSLISISDNCLLRVLKHLCDEISIIVPEHVKAELVDTPLQTRRFAFKAMMMQHFMQHGVINMFAHERLNDEAMRILSLTDGLLKCGNRNIKVLHTGEAEALATLKLTGNKLFLIDERTTRLVLENPDQLVRYIGKRTGLQLELDKAVARQISSEFKDISIIRSAELIALAYERGFLEQFDSVKTLQAALYTLKFSGCSITDEEIADYCRLLK